MPEAGKEGQGHTFTVYKRLSQHPWVPPLALQKKKGKEGKKKRMKSRMEEGKEVGRKGKRGEDRESQTACGREGSASVSWQLTGGKSVLCRPETYCVDCDNICPNSCN